MSHESKYKFDWRTSLMFSALATVLLTLLFSLLFNPHLLGLLVLGSLGLFWLVSEERRREIVGRLRSLLGRADGWLATWQVDSDTGTRRSNTSNSRDRPRRRV